MLTHELVHCYQWDAEGTCPGGLIEGVADWVRLNCDLSPPHWKKEVDGGMLSFIIYFRFYFHFHSVRFTVYSHLVPVFLPFSPLQELCHRHHSLTTPIRVFSPDWDRGYQHTAYFLQYLEQRFGEGTVRRLNDKLRGSKYKCETFWPELLGESVEKLYGDYAQKEKDDGER